MTGLPEIGPLAAQTTNCTGKSPEQVKGKIVKYATKNN